jgi:hypothetical protein
MLLESIRADHVGYTPLWYPDLPAGDDLSRKCLHFSAKRGLVPGISVILG